MSRMLIGTEVDMYGNVGAIFVGGCPWTGIERYTLKEAFDKKIQMDNMILSERLDLMFTVGTENKYTAVDYTGKQLRVKFVVLAKAKTSAYDVFFVTSGVGNPLWLTVDSIVRNIEKEGWGLANCKLELKDGNYEIVPLAGEIEEVDYTETQVAYRKYLKELKKQQEDRDGTYN